MLRLQLEKTLFFIRHNRLDLPYQDHSEMPGSVLADLAVGKLNPSILQDVDLESLNFPLGKIDKIYSSPSTRSVETARLLQNLIKINFHKKIEVIITPELNEVEFSLDKGLLKDIDRQRLISYANNFVFKSTVRGGHAESIESVLQRVKNLFKKLDPDKESSELFITHDFLMRVIELYIKNQGEISKSILLEDLKNTQRNLYLRGFATTSKLTSLAYI